jgi:hypothetical protein
VRIRKWRFPDARCRQSAFGVQQRNINIIGIPTENKSLQKLRMLRFAHNDGVIIPVITTIMYWMIPWSLLQGFLIRI